MRRILISLVIVIIIVLTGLALVGNIFASGPMVRSDNPVHLASVHYLKTVLLPKYGWISGWYPYVFLGIPIQLYSHQLGIWLVVLVSNMGVPLVLSYKLVVFFSYVAPAAALFYILKSRFGIIAAAFPAVFFLFQIEYTNLLMAGMWNSGIGLIFLLVLLHFLDKHKNANIKNISVAAIILSAVLLSHLFVGLSAFLLILSAAILYTYKHKSPTGPLWLLAIPLSILLVSFYTFPLAESGGWLASVGWGLGDNIFEILYNLAGIFFSLKQNTYFLHSVFGGAGIFTGLYMLLKGVLVNLPTITIDLLAVFGATQYIKSKNKNNFLSLVVIFTVFMLIIGSGFWYLFGVFDGVPFLSSIISYKFVYYSRVVLYIFASFFIFLLTKKAENSKSAIRLFKYSLLLILLISLFSNRVYSPFGNNLQTFSQAEISKETQALWNWLGNNTVENTNIADPVTFRDEGIASQSTILALTKIYANISALTTWVTSYHPIEKHLSSDNWRVFNIPRDEITGSKIKENMIYFNAKYIITIDEAMKNKLNSDLDFKLIKAFEHYSVYELENYEPALFISENMFYTLIEQTEQSLVFYANNRNISDSEVVVKIAYHKYWSGSMDNVQINLRKNEKELISFVIPPGKHLVKLVYSPIRPFHLAISMVSFAFVAFVLLFIKMPINKNAL